MASAPSACSSAASCCPSLSRRPDTTTCAPSCAKMTAAARPMPVSAPVTSTTFLLKPDMESPLVFRERFNTSRIRLSAVLMCRHRRQIWHSEEYRLFLTGMHSGEEGTFFGPAFEAGESLFLG